MSKRNIDEGESRPRKNNGAAPAKEKEKERAKKNKINWKWIVQILVTTLLLSFSTGLLIELIYFLITSALWLFLVAVFLVILIIALAVVADMIAVAATACDIEPLHAMAARKVRGAKKAVKICQNSDKVSSIFGDIIGDVCGIVSGASSATISAVLAGEFIGIGVWQTIFISGAVLALVAALTISMKAICKKVAITRANDIIYGLAKLTSLGK